jgi:hypothetical protein
MKSSTEVSHKLKAELPRDPAIPLAGKYPKESKSASNRDTFSLIHNSQVMELV